MRNPETLPNCPVETMLLLISNRWKVLILHRLQKQPMRFTALKESISGISQKVLTANLRALEEDGLISRTAYAEVPPRVEYALTELGHSLTPVLDSMDRWGQRYIEHLKETTRDSA